MSIWGTPITLGGGGGGGPVIPSGYQQIEYVDLGSSGKVYYDLGIAPSNHYAFANIIPTTVSNNNIIFGTSAGKNYFHNTIYSSAFYWGRNGNEANSSSYVNAAKGGRYEIHYNKGSNYSIVINGFSCDSGTSITVASDKNLLIGKRDGSYVGKGIMFFAFQLTDKSTDLMVRNLIPVRRLADSEIGFWDTINQVFYANQDVGTPIAGPDVT